MISCHGGIKLLVSSELTEGELFFDLNMDCLNVGTGSVNNVIVKAVFGVAACQEYPRISGKTP